MSRQIWRMYDSQGPSNDTASSNWFCSGPTMASRKARMARIWSTTSVMAGTLVASLELMRAACKVRSSTFSRVV